MSGWDFISSKDVNATASGRGLVVVFLSARCPCSNSHIAEIKALAEAYRDFRFIAVHANPDESKESMETYFRGVALPFPVVHDVGLKIADEFKALKTPHVFVVSATGEALYRGGVSNSNDFQKADRRYLREALEDITNGRSVRSPEGRTLGCAITRSGKNVW